MAKKTQNMYETIVEMFELDEKAQAALKKLGFKDSTAHKLTVDHLTKIGLTELDAEAIVEWIAEQKQKKTAPANPEHDGNLAGMLGNLAGAFGAMVPLANRSLRDLLVMTRDGNKEPELLQAIREKTQGLSCIVLDSDDKVDVSATLEAFEFMSDTDDRPAGIITMSLAEAMQRVREACPWYGQTQALSNDRSRDGLNWKGVSREWRIAIRYGRRQGLLSDNTDPHAVIADAKANNRDGRMIEVFAQLEHARKRNPEQVAMAEADLRYQPSAARQHRPQGHQTPNFVGHVSGGSVGFVANGSVTINNGGGRGNGF